MKKMLLINKKISLIFTSFLLFLTCANKAMHKLTNTDLSNFCKNFEKELQIAKQDNIQTVAMNFKDFWDMVPKSTRPLFIKILFKKSAGCNKTYKNLFKIFKDIMPSAELLIIVWNTLPEKTRLIHFSQLFEEVNEKAELIRLFDEKLPVNIKQNYVDFLKQESSIQ